MLWLTQIFGRLHPILVHLPIGILFLGFLFECLGFYPGFKGLRRAVQPTIVLGTVSAIFSALSGYFLSREGGYDDRLVMLHQNFGIATAVFATVLCFARQSIITRFPEKKKRKRIRILLFLPLIVLVTVTGHLGGSLTHGEDFLLPPPAATGDEATPKVKIKSIEAADSAVLYGDVIEPVLEAKCYSCHSAAKQKGQLRLDSEEFIRKGGKHGVVVKTGVADSSLLYRRLMLPLEDEKHMPPNEKSQLTSSEIALVQAWIEEGASFDKRVMAFRQVARIKGFISSLIAPSHSNDDIPVEEVSPPDEKAVQALTAKGILVVPVSEENHYLSVSYVNDRKVSDADLRDLLPLTKQIVWLNLGRTKITNEGLKTVAQLTSLRQLHLEYTGIDDAGVKALLPLEQLRLLNLVGTNLHDEGLNHLASLKNLKKLFIYKTAVTPAAIGQFSQKTKNVTLDTGSYQLPVLSSDSVVYKRKS
jgi:uncharacterized membrane protein